MNCRQATSALEALTLGPLDNTRAAQLDEHLGACRRCRALAERLGRIDVELKQAWPDATPPDALKWRILNQARGLRPVEVTEPVRRWPRVAAWAAAAAAALVLAVLVGRELPVRPERVTVQLELPKGTTLAHEPEFTVVRARTP